MSTGIFSVVLQNTDSDAANSVEPAVYFSPTSAQLVFFYDIGITKKTYRSGKEQCEFSLLGRVGLLSNDKKGYIWTADVFNIAYSYLPILKKVTRCSSKLERKQICLYNLINGN